MKGLLLLDVDGPLNPYAAKPHRRPQGYDTHRLSPQGHRGQPYRVWLSKEHGPMLLDFAKQHNIELVWCTTWEHDANRLIGPNMGLPELPVIEFGWTALQWKFSAVLEYARGRQIAWLDDDFDIYKQEKQWFEDQRSEPTLLHWIDPKIGLKQEDLDKVGEWFAQG